MSSKLWGEMTALLSEAIVAGSAHCFREDDGPKVFAWVDGDVFSLELVQNAAIIIGYQNTSSIVIRGTPEWDVFANAVAGAELNDKLGYAASRSVVAAVVGRLNGRKT